MQVPEAARAQPRAAGGRTAQLQPELLHSGGHKGRPVRVSGARALRAALA